MSQKFPDALIHLIAHLKKLPGVGQKTAERFAFELITRDDLTSFAETLTTLQEAVPLCTTCGCLTNHGNCVFCKNRDTSALCIIASPKDAYAIESTHSYRGLYHVIEHLLSPLDGRHTETLRLDRIQKRIDENQIKELIIALDSTLEGDTTALYIKSHLQCEHVSISRLAFGIPIGASLDYIDSHTLLRALSGRQNL